MAGRPDPLTPAGAPFREHAAPAAAADPAARGRPRVLVPRLDGVPGYLTRSPRWVCWRLESRGGKWTKLPIDAHSGRSASSTDPTMWSDFDTAVAAMSASGHDGVGLIFTDDDDLMGIDLDDCLEEGGRPSEGARELMEEFGSYAEVSPSGTGLKIFVRGAKPTDR